MRPKRNPTRPRRSAAWLTLALLAVTVAGCAAGGMKGTPFWTEDHEERKGTPEGRINGWPVLYYRDPALPAHARRLHRSPKRSEVHIRTGARVDTPNVGCLGGKRPQPAGAGHRFSAVWAVERYRADRKRALGAQGVRTV